MKKQNEEATLEDLNNTHLESEHSNDGDSDCDSYDMGLDPLTSSGMKSSFYLRTKVKQNDINCSLFD